MGKTKAWAKRAFTRRAKPSEGCHGIVSEVAEKIGFARRHSHICPLHGMRKSLPFRNQFDFQPSKTVIRAVLSAAGFGQD